MVERACFVIVLFAVITGNTCDVIDLEMSSQWVPDFGWEVKCFWKMLPNDTLQSVRLQRNGQQFMIYRPEIHGRARSESFPAADMTLGVQCVLNSEGGRMGECLLTVQPRIPPAEVLKFNCEVSGERPTFVIESKDYILKTLVPPSEAKLQREPNDSAPGRVMLNCSSTGLPAPSLQWTVGDDKVQADFSGRVWNSTSKLWQAWSSLAYARWQQPALVTCSPEIAYNHEVVKGTPVAYSSANVLDAAKVTLLVMIVSVMLRWH